MRRVIGPSRLNERADLPPFTFSAGLAHSSHVRSLPDLIALADGALMRAKAEGRNRIIRAEPSLGVESLQVRAARTLAS